MNDDEGMGPGTMCDGCGFVIQAGDRVKTEGPSTVQTYPTPPGHYYGGIFCTECA